MSIESVMLSNYLILCCSLLFLPSLFPSINESVLCIRYPKYWSLSFSISSSNEFSGLISFRTDWFDLPAVQGTLKSLLQHHSSKISVIWPSAFYMAQLSHLCMTTRKTAALTIQTFVSKVMSLLFNMLFRFVIAFLPGASIFNLVATVTIRNDFGIQQLPSLPKSEEIMKSKNYGTYEKGVRRYGEWNLQN